jgi:hypothetical protein
MKRFLGWGYLVFLLAALSCGSVTAFAGEAPQSSDCGLKQLASIDLDIGTYVLMPVTIDGTPARMGLTTSSGISSISKRDANAMGLAISKAPPSLIGTLGIATINSFSLGSYGVGKVQMLVNSGLPTSNPNVPPYVGWFALTSLLEVDFELDFAHNKLNVFSTTHCAGNVVYWTDKAASVSYSLDKIGVPVFAMELDGKRLAATVQAGGSNTRLRTDFSKVLYGFDEHSPGIQTRTADGKSVSHYRAMKMTARGLSVTNADVELVPGSKGCTVSSSAGPERSAAYADCLGSVPLTLGLDVLQHLRLYFATKEHILYFTAADAGMPAGVGAQ